MRTEETFDRFSKVIVRRPGSNLAEGISPARGIPDPAQALDQHALYCQALEKCGAKVTVVESDPDFPDGCFVNDIGIITESIAIISNFSDNSPRQGEQQVTAPLLANSRFLKFITSPGRMDSGDIARIRDHFYISLTDHTNEAGAEQVSIHLQDLGYKVTILDLSEENILRLSTAITYLGKDRILVREELARHYAFLEYDKVVVSAKEAPAANAFLVNGTLIIPQGYPETLSKVEALGISCITVDISEFEKMNGGLNCLSLKLPHAPEGRVVPLPRKSYRIAA